MTTTYEAHVNSEWGSSLDSLEGVPDVFEPHVKVSEGSVVQQWAHDIMAWIAAMLPGMGLAFLLAFVAYKISERVHGAVSQITLAVAFGLVLRNTIGVPKAYEPGLRLCLRSILRLGIVIMGLTLSIVAVGGDALLPDHPK